MITLIVRIKVREDALDAWVTATLANAAESQKEAGVLSFELLADRDDTTRFALVERYRDEAAIAAHKQTAHYARWCELAEPLQAEPRTRAFYRSFEAADPRPGVSA
ncbi:MAG: putative quinol monooxygenase [Spirochaetota bacterium]